MRPKRKISRGIQAVVAGVTSIAGVIVTATPSIIPLLDPEPAKIFGVVVAIGGAVVSTLSKPPRRPLMNEGDHHGEL